MGRRIGYTVFSLFCICLACVLILILVAFMEAQRERAESDKLVFHYHDAFTKIREFRQETGSWPTYRVHEDSRGLISTAAELELLGVGGRRFGYLADHKHIYLYMPIGNSPFTDIHPDDSLNFFQEEGPALLKRYEYDPTNGMASKGLVIKVYRKVDHL